MSDTSTAVEKPATGKIKNKKKVYTGPKKSFKTYIKRYWQLYLLLLLPIAYLLIFKYLPMRYVLLAFKEYKLNMPLMKMPWANVKGTTDIFKYFKTAFGNPDFRRALINTVKLNLLDLVCGFPAPILFALILNELPFKGFKKAVQTIAYMPHFLSWVIIASLCTQLFAPTDGMINSLLSKMGLSTIPFLDDPSHWVITYVLTGVWQSFGWGSIIYLSALSAVDTQLHEAAEIDGAVLLQRIWHIDIPCILPTATIMLVLSC